jgi:uncharacterized lipoprotein
MKSFRLTLMAATVVVLAACSTTPTRLPELVAAQEALREARAQPLAARAASVELQQAEQALRAKRGSWPTWPSAARRSPWR